MEYSFQEHTKKHVFFRKESFFSNKEPSVEYSLQKYATKYVYCGKEPSVDNSKSPPRNIFSNSIQLRPSYFKVFCLPIPKRSSGDKYSKSPLWNICFQQYTTKAHLFQRALYVVLSLYSKYS